MPREWMDVSHLSFNTLLLLEQVQLSWLPGRLPVKSLRVALRANPAVEWYLRRKSSQINGWLNLVMAEVESDPPDKPEAVRQAEAEVLTSITDLIVYAVNPVVYDRQPFLNWDNRELTGLIDFTGATVIDVGAGTGRLALAVADKARAVFAVEPVGNLRSYLKTKAREKKFDNVFPVDGLISDIPFPQDFADVSMAGHVYDGDPIDEYRELMRVTRPGGLIILCPGNDDVDNERHKFLVTHRFQWSRLDEPRDGMKRKYWRSV